MKKFFIVFLILFVNSLHCFGIEEIKKTEEIVLEKEGLNLEHISDLYYGKAEDSNKLNPVFKLFTEKGLAFENSRLNAIKVNFLFDGQLNFTKPDNNNESLNYDFAVVEPMVSMYFNDKKTKFMLDMNLVRDLEGYDNKFTEKISQLYISHKIMPNQTVLIGQGERIPTTLNGSRGTMGQDFVLKSQLGRTFGNFWAAGIRNKGQYKYLDYDIGLYDSTRMMKSFGNGTDFTGYVMFKPLANIDNEASNWKIGGGYNTGKYKNSYSQYSVYTGYDYKKFHVQAEYADADGYNGLKESQNRANGFYTTLAYDITPKIALLGRYDYFTSDKHNSSLDTNEYTAGITYKPYKNMKIMLNYVRKNYSNKPDSNMILFATRFIL
ncbi:MAG: OprO/OprP family phosphate-selective porin [Candidatus Gastranaerophilales bacterium]|nr:OprO/OprP family phosphate-selective porin [Candidatus Gastranaerophilales bacterium]